MAEQLPIWQDFGVEPPDLLKTNGWQPGMKPSAQHMNWLFNRIYKCLEEIQAGGGTEELEQELADLQLAFEEHLTEKASLNGVGHVQLSNLINGTSQTKAATEKAVSDVLANVISWARNKYVEGTLQTDPNTTNLSLILVQGHPNAPTGGIWYIMTNIYQPTDSKSQIAVSYNKDYGRGMYWRDSFGGVWQPWVKLVDMSMINVPNGVLGLDANGQFPEGLMKGTMKKISTTNLTTGNIVSFANLGAYKKLRFILKDVKFAENVAAYIYLNINDDTLGSITGSLLTNGVASNIGNTADIALIRVDGGTGRMNGVLDIGGVVSKREVQFKFNSYAETTAKNASQYNYDFTGYVHGAVTSVDKVSFKATTNGATFGVGTLELWGEL